MRGDLKGNPTNRWAAAAAGALVGATSASFALTVNWSAARSAAFDGDIWRGATASAATITALVAASFLGMWWRNQLEAPALWWSLAMAAVGTHLAIDLAAVLVEPGTLPPLIEALQASTVAIAAFFTLRAVLSPSIDLVAAPARGIPAAVGIFALGGILWLIVPSEWVLIAGWAAVAGIALAHGLRSRDSLAGWFAVGVLGVLHQGVVAYDTLPDAVVSVTGGIILELSLMLMLLGVFHHMEKSHVDLGRRLSAANAREHFLKAARADSFDESEERLHEARSALSALDMATRLMPTYSGSFPLRAAIRNEVAVLRRLVIPGPATLRLFRVADALVGAVAVERLHGLAVGVSVSSELHAFGDLPATAEVIQCLLENARVHASGAAISVAAYRSGDEILVSIADEGGGIESGLADRIFERGFTTGAGQGLGLAIASRTMQEQGGRLWLDVEAETGARFMMAIPASSATHDLSDEIDDVRRSPDVDLSSVTDAVNDHSLPSRRVEGDGGIGI